MRQFILKNNSTKVFIVFLILASCSNYSDDESLVTVNAMNYQPTLQAFVHTLEDDMNLLLPREAVNIEDEYLIISDGEDEGFLKVFSLPELEFLYSWGKIGQGPEEYEHIPLTELNTFKDQLIVYDIGKRRLDYYTVNDTTLIRNKGLSLSYEGQTNVMNNIKMVKNDLFIANYGSAIDTNKEFIALEPGNEVPLFKFGHYPSSDLSGLERYFADFKTSATSPDGTKFAAFYLYKNMFKIFNSKGQQLKKVLVEDDYITKQTVNPGSFQYRSLKAVSNNHLYLLGIYEDRDAVNENIESFRTSVEVWDWTGEQLYRSRFDRPIHGFTVSEKYDKIYAYSHNNLHQLFEYDIPSNLSEDE